MAWRKFGTRGPSPISTSTFSSPTTKSQPHSFEATASNWEIENAKYIEPRSAHRHSVRDQPEQPINFQRIFNFYTRQDAPFVEAVEKHNSTKRRPLMARCPLSQSRRLERQIDRAIDLNPLVLLVLSERSINGDWVEWEASRVRNLKKRLKMRRTPRDVPYHVALDNVWQDCDWPGTLRRQIEDYAGLGLLQMGE